MAGNDWQYRLLLQVAMVMTLGALCTAQPRGQIYACPFFYDLCDMEQVVGVDDFDWSWSPNQLTSSGQAHNLPGDTQITGPDGSQGRRGGGYAFVEASAPRTDFNTAKLRTPALNYNGAACLEFYFHLRGSNVGRLQVQQVSPGGRSFDLFEISGPQGDNWVRQEVTVPLSDRRDRVEFTATLGSGPDMWSGDIAIDTVQIIPGICRGGPPRPPTPGPPTFAPPTDQARTTFPSPTLTSPAPSPRTDDQVILPYSCDFETSLCGLVQESTDVFDWTRLRESTPTIGTGPPRAFSGTWFMFIESSDPQQPNDFAVLHTQPILHQGPTCLTFAYHMNGPDIGRLFINTTYGGNRNPWYTKIGDQGGNWQLVSVNLRLRYYDTVRFVGVRGRDIRGDIAIDSIRIDSGFCRGVPPATPRPTPTSRPTPVPPDSMRRLPWSCDFETNYCGMVQPNTDRFDWMRQAVSTPTDTTGPDRAQQGNYFVYAEASDPRVPGDTAELLTPMFNNQGQACVMFYFHMYGSGMGSLRVYVSRRGAARNFFERIGSQGDQWNFVSATATGLFFGDQITFEATRGQSYTSDIALDAIRIEPGRCGVQPPVPTPTPTSQPPGTADGISCDIERIQVSDRNCILRQDRREDQIDWERGEGKTPSGALYSRRLRNNLFPVTGPMSASQGRFYLFIEASGKPRDLVARLFIEGDDVRRGGRTCLRFAYSMNGFHIGELRVISRTARRPRVTRWSMSGDQGQGWQRAAVDLDLNGISEVGVEATTKGEFSGDIAVDDFRLTPGACTTTPSQFIFVCNFETGDGSATLCNMVQDQNDRFDWTLWRDGTPSLVTGPDRAFSGNYYIYIEASRPRNTGDVAIITTPALNVNGDICVEFAYHMYGFHIGTLEMFSRDDFNADTVQWSETGQQGNRWLQNRVTVSNFRAGSLIGFRGVRGAEYSGDIAIDSVMIRRGGC